MLAVYSTLMTNILQKHQPRTVEKLKYNHLNTFFLSGTKIFENNKCAIIIVRNMPCNFLTYYLVFPI